jgi:serine/threonine-protein kinase
MLIRINNVEFELKEDHDFSWLEEIGTVFNVFDENDSGNISFGVSKDGKNYFVKYAGAKTKEYMGEVETAIHNLEYAIEVYENLQHRYVISLIKKIVLPHGIAAIFEWVEGECLFAHWTFGKWDRYTSPNSPYVKYKKLSIEKRMESIKTIFEFMMSVESKNYVAVDFYDGSILYDFQTDTTKICDIDFFHKKPMVNDKGEDYWGSKRMKAPEEYELGALIDSDTNVFGIGRLILGLLGDENDYSIDKWEAKEYLYEIVIKATNPDRAKRFQTIEEFYDAWSCSEL